MSGSSSGIKVAQTGPNKDVCLERESSRLSLECQTCCSQPNPAPHLLSTLFHSSALHRTTTCRATRVKGPASILTSTQRLPASKSDAVRALTQDATSRLSTTANCLITRRHTLLPHSPARIQDAATARDGRTPSSHTCRQCMTSASGSAAQDAHFRLRGSGAWRFTLKQLTPTPLPCPAISQAVLFKASGRPT